MHDLLTWLYLVNSVFLINHEIDSAYWHEWKLFRLPGGISGFLILHFPFLLALLYGFRELVLGEFAGLIASLILSAVGIFAFCIHMFFIIRGHDEFKKIISIFILAGILAISLVQGGVTIYLFTT